MDVAGSMVTNNDTLSMASCSFSNVQAKKDPLFSSFGKLVSSFVWALGYWSNAGDPDAPFDLVLHGHWHT